MDKLVNRDKALLEYFIFKYGKSNVLSLLKSFEVKSDNINNKNNKTIDGK